MLSDQKVQVFSKELDYINNQDIRRVTMKALEKVDDKFFTAPASSTGKYHPSYALGKGGLVRHTKVAVEFAHILMRLKSSKTTFGQPDYSDYSDYAVAALILHDTCKSGVKWEGKYSKHEHPILVNQLLSKPELGASDYAIWTKITDLIATHMGQWTTSNHSKIILPEPSTPANTFVHICDYLAAQKSINIDLFTPEELKGEFLPTELTVASESLQELRTLVEKAKDILKPDVYTKFLQLLDSGTLTESEIAGLSELLELKISVKEMTKELEGEM